MMKIFDRKIRRFFAEITALALPIVIGGALLARDPPRPDGLSAETRQSITAVGGYVNEMGGANRLLDEKLGFPPPDFGLEPHIWRSLSAEQQVTMVVLAAREANAGSEQKILAMLSAALARQYDGAKVDPALVRLHGGYDGDADSFAKLSKTEEDEKLVFKRPPLEAPQHALNDATRKKAQVLSFYLSNASFGGPANFLQEHFELSDFQAADLLLRAGTFDDALIHELGAVDPKTLDRRFDALTTAAARAYDAVKYERVLADHLQRAKLVATPPREGLSIAPQQKRARPIRLLLPGEERTSNVSDLDAKLTRRGSDRGLAWRPVVPASSLPRAERAGRYNSFVRKSFGKDASASGVSFRRLSRGIRGFGGVVFGESIESDKTVQQLGKPLQIEYRADRESGRGSILVRFAKKAVAYPNVNAEDAFAALAIVFRGVNLDDEADSKIPPLERGAGLGIVGLADGRIAHDVGDEALTMSQHWNVLLHPAVDDIDLGWAALLADALPIALPALLARIENDPLLENEKQRLAARNAIGRLFESERDQEGYLGTWKIVDVPMVIGRDGDQLFVARKNEEGKSWPEGVRRTCFIEMHPIIWRDSQRPNGLDTKYAVSELPLNPNEQDGAGNKAQSDDDVNFDVDHEFASEFYRALPDITRASYDYQRLNAFAPVLSLTRWAKQEGAKLVGDMPPQPKESRTPEAIAIVDRSSITPIPAYTRIEATRRELDDVQRRIKAFEADNEMAEKLRDYQALVSASSEYERESDAADFSQRRTALLLMLASINDAIVKRLAADAELSYFHQLSRLRSQLFYQDLSYQIEDADGSDE